MRQTTEERKLPPLMIQGMSWDKARRGQIRELFRNEVYGAVPPMEVKTTSELMGVTELPGLGVRKELLVILESGGNSFCFPLYLYIPQTEKEKVPVALYIENKPRIPVPMDTMLQEMTPERLHHFLGEQAHMIETMMTSAPKPKPCDIQHRLDNPYWPVEDLLKRGIATAAFYTEDIAEDQLTDYENGLFGFFGGNAVRDSHSWGTVSAWAYGAGRAIDILCRQPMLDTAQIAVVGHSRGGKTALWCAANDERVACCYANNSGCTGAALSRGKKGEQLLHINTMFPHWFCEKYKEYNGREEELPIDQHMLLALIAPRPLYLASADRDLWADPGSEFLSARAASEAYEALGLHGLCCETMPKPGSPSHEGRIGYHVREGGHALTREDWMQFCDFWMRHQS